MLTGIRSMQCHAAVMRDRWHKDTIIVSVDAEAMDQSLPDAANPFLPETETCLQCLQSASKLAP